MGALKIVGILGLLIAIGSAFGPGGFIPASIPAGIAIWWIIKSDKQNKAIDEFFGLMFMLMIVGGVLSLFR